MKIRYIYIVIFVLAFLVSNKTIAQILPVSEVIQEQSEWCWAGVSKCILDYYGDTTEQCEIAEYTRNVATWHNFGNTDCCVNPSLGCNYWNYGYGISGSIVDILVFHGGIYSYGTSSVMTEQDITYELSNGRPFVIRWGWYSGGGHFVVGYGKVNQTVYYMNPWFGEGMKFANYNWVKDDGIHQWTHTNVLTSSPSDIVLQENQNDNKLRIIPNPSNGEFTLQLDFAISKGAQISIVDVNGAEVFSIQTKESISDIRLESELPGGMYFVKVINGASVFTEKLIVL